VLVGVHLPPPPHHVEGLFDILGNERVALAQECAHLLDLRPVVVLALEHSDPRARVLQLPHHVPRAGAPFRSPRTMSLKPSEHSQETGHGKPHGSYDDGVRRALHVYRRGWGGGRRLESRLEPLEIKTKHTLLGQ